jgi:hypothetical protein
LRIILPPKKSPSFSPKLARAASVPWTGEPFRLDAPRPAAVQRRSRSPPGKDKTMKIGLVSAAAAAVLALSQAAAAQAPTPPAKAAAPPPATPATTVTSDYVEQRLEGNQVVTFPGDTLPGDNNSTYGFNVRPAPGVVRQGLIRPRVNFVSELLKSVENL